MREKIRAPLVCSTQTAIGRPAKRLCKAVAHKSSSSGLCVSDECSMRVEPDCVKAIGCCWSPQSMPTQAANWLMSDSGFCGRVSMQPPVQKWKQNKPGSTRWLRSCESLIVKTCPKGPSTSEYSFSTKARHPVRKSSANRQAMGRVIRSRMMRVFFGSDVISPSLVGQWAHPDLSTIALRLLITCSQEHQKSYKAG